MDFAQAAHLCATVFVVAFLTFLSGWIHPNGLAEHSDNRAVAMNVRRATAILFLVWAFTYLLYFPIMLFRMPSTDYSYWFGVIFHVVNVLAFPVCIWVIEAFLQFRSRYRQWLPLAVGPSLLCFGWYIVEPTRSVLNYCVIVQSAVLAGFFVYLYRRYRRYAELLHTEYSDVSRRELRWVWCVFVMVMLQAVTCVLCTVWDNYTMNSVNLAAGVITSYYISRSACRMLPLSDYLIEEEYAEAEATGAADEVSGSNATISRHHADAHKPLSAEEGEGSDSGDTKVHALIRQKLKTVCEGRRLYLDPELTREALCAAIKVNRTYLSRYLREEGTTYYQYINKLRIEYAVQLMRDEPNLSLIDVCMRSGFSNTSTFRRSFRDLKGCLPSEYKG